MKLTFGEPALAAVWKTLFTTSAGTSLSTWRMTTPGKSFPLGFSFFQSSLRPFSALKSSSMRGTTRPASSTARVEPTGCWFTRIWLPLMATIGAVTMSSVFSAIGRVIVLSVGISPDALNDIRRKTTIVTRKSIMLVRLSDAATPR